jgi:hypothetical protein
MRESSPIPCLIFVPLAGLLLDIGFGLRLKKFLIVLLYQASAYEFSG